MHGAQKRDTSIPVVVTARRMADAVEYLSRVAHDAGLCGIAGKLTRIRTNLLNVAAGESEDQQDDKHAANNAIVHHGDARNERH
jgi:hypothetical protein